MARQAKTLKELARVRADNRRLLNAVAGNQGTALGRKNFTPQGEPTGDPCIIIYMPHKLNEALLDKNVRVPSVLRSSDGKLEALTDVVVTTVPSEPKEDPPLSQANEDLVRTLQWRDGRLDHLPPGAQIGGYELGRTGIGGYFGTIGYAVRNDDGSLVGVLTNEHVGGTASRSMYVPGGNQPSVRVGVTRTVREHYADDEWMPGVDERFAYVRSDAAFVVIEERLRAQLRNEVPTVGPIAGMLPVNFDSLDVIGMPVKKVGRTTGLSEGVVVAYGYGIPNANEIIDRELGAEPANVYTDFLIAPTAGFEAFSAPGDSGSPIVTQIDGKVLAVGLLWGGWPTDVGRGGGVEDLTYGINLSRLLAAMKLNLL